MRTLLKIMLLAVIMSFLFTGCLHHVHASSSRNFRVEATIDEARANLEEAYNVTVYAEKSGADVSEAVKKLNSALDYINQAQSLLDHGDPIQAADFAQASIELSQETIALDQELKAQAAAQSFSSLVVSAAATIAAICLVLGAAYMGWRYWKRHHKTQLSGMQDKRSKQRA